MAVKNIEETKEKLLSLERLLQKKDILLLMLCSKSEKPFFLLTSVKDIVANDYILSANTYNPYSGEEKVSHREPKEILGEIEKLSIDLQIQKELITKSIK